jgi:hypothetical protein
MGVFRGSVRTILRQVGTLLGGYRKLRRASRTVKAIVVIAAFFLCAACLYPLSFLFDEPPPEANVPVETVTAPINKVGEGDGQPTGCACSEDYYDCPDFENQAAAQECYEYCMEQEGVVFDIHGLDTDGDGVACDGWDYQQ